MLSSNQRPFCRARILPLADLPPARIGGNNVSSIQKKDNKKSRAIAKSENKKITK